MQTAASISRSIENTYASRIAIEFCSQIRGTTYNSSPASSSSNKTLAASLKRMLRTDSSDIFDGLLDLDAEATQAYSESAYKDFLAATGGTVRTQEDENLHDGEDQGVEANLEGAGEVRGVVDKIEVLGPFQQTGLEINNGECGKEDDNQSLDAVDSSSMTSDGQYDMLHLHPRTPVAQKYGQVGIPSSATTPGLPVNPFAATNLNAPGVMGLSQVFKATQAVTPFAKKLASDPPTDRPSPDIYNARHTPAQLTSVTPLHYVQSDPTVPSAHLLPIPSSSPKSPEQHIQTSPSEQSPLKNRRAREDGSENDLVGPGLSQDIRRSMQRREMDRTAMTVLTHAEVPSKSSATISVRDRRSHLRGQTNNERMPVTIDKRRRRADNRETAELQSDAATSSSQSDHEEQHIEGLRQRKQVTESSNSIQPGRISSQAVQVPMTSARRVYSLTARGTSQESPLSSKMDRLQGPASYDVRFSQSSQRIAVDFLNENKSSGSVVVEGTQIEKPAISSPAPNDYEQSRPTASMQIEVQREVPLLSIQPGRSVSPALSTAAQAVPSINGAGGPDSTAHTSQIPQEYPKRPNFGNPTSIPDQSHQTRMPSSRAEFPVLAFAQEPPHAPSTGNNSAAGAHEHSSQARSPRRDERNGSAREDSAPALISSMRTSTLPAEREYGKARPRRHRVAPPKESSPHVEEIPETSPSGIRPAKSVAGLESSPGSSADEAVLNQPARKNRKVRPINKTGEDDTEPRLLNGLLRTTRERPLEDNTRGFAQDAEVLDSQSPARPGELRETSEHEYSVPESGDNSSPILPARKRQRTNEGSGVRPWQSTSREVRTRRQAMTARRGPRVRRPLKAFKGSAESTRHSRPVETKTASPISLGETSDLPSGALRRRPERRNRGIPQSSGSSADEQVKGTRNTGISCPPSVAPSRHSRASKVSGSITHAPENINVDQHQTTSEANITKSNRVFALFKGGNTAYYPATCVSSSGTTKCRIRFDDGTVDVLNRRDVRRLELKPGDVVKVDLESMRKKNYIVVALKDKPGSSSGEEEKALSAQPCLTDIYGHSTAVLRPKSRDSLRTELPMDEEVVEQHLKDLYIVKSGWTQFSDRLHSHVTEPAEDESKSGLANEVPSIPGTPASRARRSIVATPAYGALGVTSIKITSGLFKNMVFAVSYDSSNEERNRVLKLIESKGGTLLQDGFHQLFNLDEGLTRRQQPPFYPPEDYPKPFALKQTAVSWGFACLIADQHTRRVKYLQALALGLPCLAGRWIDDCVAQNQILPWAPYLLPAGVSNFLRGAIHSRILEYYPAEGAQFTNQLQASPNLFKNKSVLYITGKGKPTESRQNILFLLYALGASRIITVVSVANANAALTEGRQKSSPWDFVYLESDMSSTEQSLGGIDDASPARRAGISPMLELPDGSHTRLINREFIVQSLILGKFCR